MEYNRTLTPSLSHPMGIRWERVPEGRVRFAAGDEARVVAGSGRRGSYGELWLARNN